MFPTTNIVISISIVILASAVITFIITFPTDDVNEFKDSVIEKQVSNFTNYRVFDTFTGDELDKKTVDVVLYGTNIYKQFFKQIDPDSWEKYDVIALNVIPKNGFYIDTIRTNVAGDFHFTDIDNDHKKDYVFSPPKSKISNIIKDGFNVYLAKPLTTNPSLMTPHDIDHYSLDDVLEIEWGLKGVIDESLLRIKSVKFTISDIGEYVLVDNIEGDKITKTTISGYTYDYRAFTNTDVIKKNSDIELVALYYKKNYAYRNIVEDSFYMPTNSTIKLSLVENMSDLFPQKNGFDVKIDVVFTKPYEDEIEYTMSDNVHVNVNSPLDVVEKKYMSNLSKDVEPTVILQSMLQNRLDNVSDDVFDINCVLVQWSITDWDEACSLVVDDSIQVTELYDEHGDVFKTRYYPVDVRSVTIDVQNNSELVERVENNAYFYINEKSHWIKKINDDVMMFGRIFE